MQQLKADLVYLQKIKSGPKTKKAKGKTSIKNVATRNQRFAEALEQSFLTLKTPLATPKTASSYVMPELKVKTGTISMPQSQTRLTNNITANKIGGVSTSDSPVKGKVQPEVKISEKTDNTRPVILNGKAGKAVPVKQANLLKTQLKGANNTAVNITGTKELQLQSLSGEIASKLGNPGAPISELKTADLTEGNNINLTNKADVRAIPKELMRKQDNKHDYKSDAILTETARNTEKNYKKGIIEKVPIKTGNAIKTDSVAAEASDNSLSMGKTGVVDSGLSEIAGPNLDKTVLSQNQIDFIVSKMIQQIKIAPSSLEVSLKPEYLGKINILVQSREGLISVNLIAQNGEALNLLNSNLQNIKDNLEQQGIQLQQMEVNLANQEKQDSQTGSRYRDDTRQRQSFVKISEQYESSDNEQISLSPYKLNLLA